MSRWLHRVFRDGTRRMPYQVFLPTGPGAATPPPIVLFLHGSGERGTDGRAPTRVGLGPVLRARPADFPFVAVFPQAPPQAYWSGQPLADAFTILETVAGELGADRGRTYLLGVSMGGFGAWQLAALHPRRFAALVPVCAGLRSPPGQPRLPPVELPGEHADPFAGLAAALRHLPTWIFHGSDDPVLPVENGRGMARALAALAAPVRYTELAHGGHNVWDAAFHLPALWEWLLAQRCAPAAPPDPEGRRRAPGASESGA